MKPTGEATLPQSRADAQKRFYGLRKDRELLALYENRYGVKLTIVSDKKYLKLKEKTRI